MTSADEKTARTRVFLVLWVAGLVGVGAYLPVVAALVPRTPKQHLPLAVVLLLVFGQSAVLLAGASAAVVFVGPALGLRAPVVEAWGARQPVGPHLRSSLAWGSCAGVLGALLATLAAPGLVAYLRSVPLPARLLYGGFVEELVMRGGLMTLLTWGAYRLVQRRGALRLVPTAAIGIVLSNALFALGHLPMLRISHDPSPGSTAGMIFVIALPWGWLYYRRGLEAAVVAHASFHAMVAAIAALR